MKYRVICIKNNFNYMFCTYVIIMNDHSHKKKEEKNPKQSVSMVLIRLVLIRLKYFKQTNNDETSHLCVHGHVTRARGQ